MKKELRTNSRQRTLLPAKILFNDKQSVFDCVVRNFSDSGARLKVSSPLGIPDHFTMLIPHYDRHFPCWVVWRELSEIGVSFFERPEVKGTPDLRIIE